MTKRDFLQAIINNDINSDVVTMATELLTKMDERQAARANATSAKRNEINAPIIDAIKAFFETTEGTHTAADVATVQQISPQKASALLRNLVAEGYLKAEDIKIPKKGKQKGYSLA